MRHLALLMLVGGSVATAGICAVALLMLFTVPRLDATLYQKGLVAAVAFSAAASTVFHFLHAHASYRASLATGVWNATSSWPRTRWWRFAMIFWMVCAVSLGLFAADAFL